MIDNEYSLRVIMTSEPKHVTQNFYMQNNFTTGFFVIQYIYTTLNYNIPKVSNYLGAFMFNQG